MFDIRARRKQLKLSQKELADMVGVAESSISRWESGDIQSMKQDKIAKMAAALKVSPVEIINLNQRTGSLSPEKQRLIDIVTNMDADQVASLLKLLDK